METKSHCLSCSLAPLVVVFLYCPHWSPLNAFLILCFTSIKPQISEVFKADTLYSQVYCIFTTVQAIFSCIPCWW